MFHRLILKTIEYQCKGRENAMTAKKLTVLINQEFDFNISERTLREAISELRQLSHPIASAVNKPAGYFWPITESEAREVMGHFYSRLKEINAIARGVERGLQFLFPKSQLKLDL